MWCSSLVARPHLAHISLPVSQHTILTSSGTHITSSIPAHNTDLIWHIYHFQYPRTQYWPHLGHISLPVSLHTILTSSGTYITSSIPAHNTDLIWDIYHFQYPRTQYWKWFVLGLVLGLGPRLVMLMHYDCRHIGNNQVATVSDGAFFRLRALQRL